MPCLACHGAGGGRGAAVEAEAGVGPADSQTLRSASCRRQVLLLDLQVGPAFHCWQHSGGDLTEYCKHVFKIYSNHSSNNSQQTLYTEIIEAR